MPLDYATPIQGTNILEVDRLKAAKVVCLTGVGGGQIVIKMDPQGAGAAGVSSSKAAMKAIDPSVGHIKVVSANELVELTNWVTQQVGFIATIKASNHVLGAARTTAASLESDHPGLFDLDSMLKSVAMYGDHLLKMPSTPVESLGTALDDRDTHGKQSNDLLSRFKKILTDPGGLEQLGEILAADLFVGNNDRCHPEGAGPNFINNRKPNERKVQFQVIVNIGNIFASLGPNGEPQRLSGLDYIDPNGSTNWAGWVKLASVESPGIEWPGRRLADSAKRREFAKKMIQDLDWALMGCPTPQPNPYKIFKHQAKDEIARLDKGMVDGCKKLCEMLQRKAKKNLDRGRVNLTVTMMERYTILKNVK